MGDIVTLPNEIPNPKGPRTNGPTNQGQGDQVKFLAVTGGRGIRNIAYLKTEPHANAQDGGNARPGLIWLPGFKSVMTSQKAVAIAEFAKNSGLALTRFDYSGHGQSSGTFEDGTIGRWLNEAGQVFKRLTTGPQILIGSSMGGWLALLLAHKMRTGTVRAGAKRLKALILIAPAVDMTENLIRKRLSPEDRKILKGDGYILYNSPYDNEPYVITKRLISKGRKHCFKGKPINTGCPVYILHGREDEDVPWQSSQALLDQLRATDVSLSVIEDGDHRLSRPQDLARLTRLIERAVERASASK